MISPAAHPARWWRPLDQGRVLCELCPRDCRPGPGQPGFCLIRRNEGGALVTDGWNAGIGFAADPIEKKPLHHVHPGSRVLSFGTAGCNLGCVFCQNWTMSQAREALGRMERATPAMILRAAASQGCRGLAFTYNEPVIFGEFLIACAEAAQEAGLYTVMVSNGYVRLPAAREIFAPIDAVNIDLKSFRDSFYRNLARGRLAPVLETLRWLRRETNVWLELTTLLIPGKNDGDEELGELCRWVAGELGPPTPLHLSAFHPDHKLTDLPRTPVETLRRARAIARRAGLQHVYLGNLPLAEGRDSCCPACQATVVKRPLGGAACCHLRGGRCPSCGKVLPGLWPS
jgi:pyruvate formate lyase activating enzyme